MEQEPTVTDAVPVDEVQTEAPEGANVVAIAFSEDLKAQEALMAAMRLQRHGRLTLDDAAIAIKVNEDKVRLIQTKDVSTPQAAVSGSWWGMLAGLFVGGPLVGLAIGAAAGGIWAKIKDIGIDDDEMRRIAESLEVDEAALFLLVTDCHRAHALFEASRFEGRLLASTFDEDLNVQLREALSQTINPWT